MDPSSDSSLLIWEAESLWQAGTAGFAIESRKATLRKCPSGPKHFNRETGFIDVQRSVPHPAGLEVFRSLIRNLETHRSVAHINGYTTLRPTALFHGSNRGFAAVPNGRKSPWNGLK